MVERKEPVLTASVCVAGLRCDSAPLLCGVTRVGLVAKGLLIKGDMDLELVLMCREKPTKLLLDTISTNLPLQIQVPSEGLISWPKQSEIDWHGGDGRGQFPEIERIHLERW